MAKLKETQGQLFRDEMDVVGKSLDLTREPNSRRATEKIQGRGEGRVLERVCFCSTSPEAHGLEERHGGQGRPA